MKTKKNISLKVIFKEIISIDLLKEYHTQLMNNLSKLFNNKLNKDENAVSASKLKTPVNINGVKFDGSSDISIKINPSITIINKKINAKENKIVVDKQYKLSNDSFTWLFINGIKQKINEHYTVNVQENSINLIETYSTQIDVEIILF